MTGATLLTRDRCLAGASVFDARSNFLNDSSRGGLSTNWERTVVDAFRLRHLAGPENANEALRRYLRSRQRLSTLLTTAHELNVGAGFADTIRVLVP